ncbi:MAG: hypothetical protein WDZ88_03920 [Candidatus Paceibacterota bacterium]
MDNNRNKNDNSGINTVLIVLILLVLVGGLVWLFAGNRAEVPNDSADASLDINLPQESDSEGSN